MRAWMHTLLGTALALGSQAAQAAWDPVNTSTAYQAIPLASDNTVNPLRGYHRWRGVELVPQSERALEAYQRYQWRDLETSPGVYNFSGLLAELATARSEGRKFALRLRMMAGYDDGQVYLPSYLVNHPSCQAGCGFWADDDAAQTGLTFVPDWNDPYLQERARALLQALAQAMGTQRHDLAWIDVGLYGQYGEWALHSALYAQAPAGILPATEASKRAFADMHFQAFPDVQQVMFALYSNRVALNYGLNQQTTTLKPVGLRVDCLARASFFDQWTHHPTDWAMFSNRWQTAPFVAEFCPFESGDLVNNPAAARQQAAQFHVSSIGNGNFASSVPRDQRWASLTDAERNDLLMLGREAGYRYALQSATVKLSSTGQLNLTAQVQNLGNAPAYEPWQLRAELVNASGTVAWSGNLAMNLRTSLGGGSSQSASAGWKLPKNLPKASYTLRLVVRSTAPAPRRALQLANVERVGEGGVVLGTLRNR
ncbi:DUF4832 domain-containing protein [Inhella proteolytica]|uniref:DUF4832 domain-containing protein n=1 Tax=Inhella proteolytica TaxID=2795029 RepID=A0A931J507_9BURK|nr:DUF4832 domain-containing protein [Inhella proteolytica]MBH9576442.1 DUF4832 domain-containing protein [Inhella proteolytica]